MSLASQTDIYQRQVESTNRERPARGFILALVCLALFLVFASMIFPPLTSGSGQMNAVWLVGS
jgi:hypothetical protein